MVADITVEERHRLNELVARAVASIIDMDWLQSDVAEWARRTFNEDNRTRYDIIEGRIVHLQEEVRELADCVLAGSDLDVAKARMEVADCTLLLLGMASAFGFSLGAAVQEKLEINKARQWGPIGPNGMAKHITEAGRE